MAAVSTSFACEVSDQIGSNACPIKVALEEFDVNQDSAVDAAEIAAAAQSTALDNTPAEQGMTNRVAEILVRMVDSDNDRLITAAELQAYNAKKG